MRNEDFEKFKNPPENVYYELFGGHHQHLPFLTSEYSRVCKDAKWMVESGKWNPETVSIQMREVVVHGTIGYDEILASVAELEYAPDLGSGSLWE
jgi:hypothetical protein